MDMSQKTTGIIVGAVSGAAVGSALALMGSNKKQTCRRMNSFTKTASHILEATGTVMLNLSDMLR